jgi:rSAM/selenodomain-associated transferase 2
MISAIVPTFNAADSLAETLDCLGGNADVGEVIVADAGSRDTTREVAAKAGAQVVECERGRGTQLAAGAQTATGDWLLFLHADTVLGDGWVKAVSGFIAEPANAERAAVFRFALDDDSRAARRLARFVSWRTRVLGLPYGDQGLLMSKAFYETLGGFKPIPLMEDVDLVRRIGKRRLVVLGAEAMTSAARYRKSGYGWRGIRNLFCLTLYFLGVAPKTIERIYR